MALATRRDFLAGASLAATGPTVLIGSRAFGGDIVTAPVAKKGEITYLPRFGSRHVAPRSVAIWQPEPEFRSGPLPVIYAGDGAELFDARSSERGITWDLDLIMDMLARRGIGPAIIVAIGSIDSVRSREYNSPTIAQYFDPELTEILEASCGGPLMTDPYLDFITNELKPYVDENFNTNPGRSDTFMMGTSMGGLLAFEAILSRADVFSGCVGFAAHMFLFGPAPLDYPEDARDRVQAAIRDAIDGHMPNVGEARVFLHRGTVDLDELYAPFHLTVAEALEAKDYIAGRDMMMVEQVGASHHAVFWSMTAPDAIEFVLRV